MISFGLLNGNACDDGPVRPSQLAKVMRDLGDPTPWPVPEGRLTMGARYHVMHNHFFLARIIALLILIIRCVRGKRSRWVFGRASAVDGLASWRGSNARSSLVRS